MSVAIRRWEEFGSQQLASPPSPLRPDLVVVRNKAKRRDYTMVYDRITFYCKVLPHFELWGLQHQLCRHLHKMGPLRICFTLCWLANHSRLWHCRPKHEILLQTWNMRNQWDIEKMWCFFFHMFSRWGWDGGCRVWLFGGRSRLWL